MISYRNLMINTGIELLRLTALGLGWNENVFDDRFLPKSVSSLRLMHYPTYKHTTQNPVLTCEEHVDGAFVTILATFSYSGLEIQQQWTVDECCTTSWFPGSQYWYTIVSFD